jgi:hypothetical protein
VATNPDGTVGIKTNSPECVDELEAYLEGLD